MAYNLMSRVPVPQESRPVALARDTRGVLVVGRFRGAALWHTCSAMQNLRCIHVADVPVALDLLSRMSPIALVVASTIDQRSLHDFCDRVRQHDAFRYAPIVVSGPRDEALRRRSRDAGADAYVADGDSAALETHIRHWINLALELEKVANRRPRAQSMAPRRRRSDRGRER
jgi:hypothetical protein